MMSHLVQGAKYSRSEIWSAYFPRGHEVKENWHDSYPEIQGTTFIFANLNSLGKPGEKYPNTFDFITKELIWFGAENSHSEQPQIKRLIHGETLLVVFVRWDTRDKEWLFLGSPNSIKSYEDNAFIAPEKKSIKFTFRFNYTSTGNNDDLGPEGFIQTRLEGKKSTVLVNKYERDPKLRLECIKHHGCVCNACGFDFEKAYGPLGKDFCHIHHLSPLHTLMSETEINPLTDLIPLCANCHNVIHRVNPPLGIDKLKELIQNQQQ